MALPIMSAEEPVAEANHETTIAAFAQTGIGKTMWLKTLPEATMLCLDLEAGENSVGTTGEIE